MLPEPPIQALDNYLLSYALNIDAGLVGAVDSHLAVIVIDHGDEHVYTPAQRALLTELDDAMRQEITRSHPRDW